MKSWILMAIALFGTIGAQAQVTGTDPCAGLSVIEQTFAQGMTASNRQMFCMRFSQSMRDTAVNQAAKPGANGRMLTPDQVVEKVAKDNNITPMSSTTPGGCGVR